MTDKSFFSAYLDKTDIEKIDAIQKKIKSSKDKDEQERLETEKNAIYNKAIQAYLAIYPTIEDIMNELQATFDQLEKSDFVEYTASAAKIVKELKKYDKSGEDGTPAGEDANGKSLNFFISYFEYSSLETFDNFTTYIMEQFCFYRIAAIGTLLGLVPEETPLADIMPKQQAQQLADMIAALYLSFYPDAKDIPPERLEAKKTVLAPDGKATYLPMYHGSITNAMAAFSSRDLRLDQITKNAIIEKDDVKMLIKEWLKLNASLGINTHKLLCTGIMLFTRYNNSGARHRQIEYTVNIPFVDYALLLGYDVLERLDALDAAKEAKRAKNADKEARKKINKELDILNNTELTVKDKYGALKRVSIIGSRTIKKDFICMTFDPEFAACLVILPITQYPIALLGIDARNPNAYLMGLKMAEHFSIYNNQQKGTADRLTVKSLLKATRLPDIEEVRKKRKSWEERIKEPFEGAMELLRACGFLVNWEYCKPKGKKMTDEEAAFTNRNYEDWAAALLKFDIVDGERLAQKIQDSMERSKERMEKRIEKKKKAGKK